MSCTDFNELPNGKFACRACDSVVTKTSRKRHLTSKKHLNRIATGDECCVCYESTGLKTDCCGGYVCSLCRKKLVNKCPLCRGKIDEVYRNEKLYDLLLDKIRVAVRDILLICDTYRQLDVTEKRHARVEMYSIYSSIREAIDASRPYTSLSNRQKLLEWFHKPLRGTQAFISAAEQT